MCLDPVFVLQIYRPCGKVSFHDPETFFYLPPSFTYLQNISNIIIKKIGTYCVKPIIQSFFRNLVFIQGIFDISRFSFWRNCCLFNKRAGSLGFYGSFCIPWIQHFLCTFHLFITDCSLISCIFRWISNDQTLVQLLRGIRFIFVIKTFVITIELSDINRSVIGYFFKSLWI